TLTMNNNSNIKVDAGSISVSGGSLAATNNYDVIYVGSSKTSGIETGISAGAHNIWVNMTDSTQTVTLGSDITVSGTMYHTMGKMAIGAHTLKLMSDYIATANGKIQAGATSRLMLELSNTSSSSITLTSGSQFQLLEVNLSTSAGANFAGSFTVDTLYMKNGSVNFANSSTLTMATNGIYIWENGSFTLGSGHFVGTNSYSVMYKGGNKTSSYEILGTGLHNVTVDMGVTANVVSLDTNLTVSGLLNMNNGTLNLNSRRLYLTGTFSSTANGTFQGNGSSNLIINNTTAAFGDSLNFATGVAQLDSLSINTMAASWVWLGTGVNVANLVFKSGGVMLTNGDLTIYSPGVITGYDSTKYVGTSGSGSLVMNVNVAAPYVLFPVGTNSNYSPASIQVMAGTAGMFHVNVQNGMWSGGTSGTNLALTQSVVNRTWFIQEPTQTGSLNANLQVEWKASEEVHGFDRTHAYISHYTGSAWDASTVGSAVSASGSFYQMTRTNISSFSPFAVVDQNATTGIDKVTANSVALSLYPNPVANFVTIDFKNTDAKSVEVYNEIGAKVYSSDIINKNTAGYKIDLSNLPAGIYYLKIGTTTEPITKKIIKS
ncbi:MAG TPA: T9SS type A sorting domain-containing protein, partial [Bacteroidia bacterium]|nr:T9SS type A sorting domain-containing protein [Bacteroidia bacterium]